MDVHSSSDHNRTVPAHRSRRAVLGLALGTALGSIGLPAGLAAAKPKRNAKRSRQAEPRGRRNGKARSRPQPKPRYKVVTRTFTSAVPITIVDDEPATPYPAVLTVAGLRGGKLLDLNVTLSGFTHTTPRDVDLLLVAPNGLSAVIMSDVGEGIPDEVTNLTLVLDDQAPLPLPTTEGLISGIFRPHNFAITGDEADPFPAPASFSPNVTLATFNGINPNGAWQLFVVDDISGDEGSIASWALTIRARVQLPRRPRPRPRPLPARARR